MKMSRETADALMEQRRVMNESLPEALRKAKEQAWDECCEAVASQGTVQIPDNPYTVEAVNRRKAEEAQEVAKLLESLGETDKAD